MAAASSVSELIAESAAMISTTAKGICVQTWATTTEISASCGEVSQGIEPSIRCEIAQQAVEHAEARVEHPDPQHRADGARQHPGQQHDRADDLRAEEAALQEQRDQRAEDDDERRGEEREDQRVAQRVLEIVAGDDALVVVEADEGLVRETAASPNAGWSRAHGRSGRSSSAPPAGAPAAARTPESD